MENVVPWASSLIVDNRDNQFTTSWIAAKIIRAEAHSLQINRSDNYTVYLNRSKLNDV